VVQESLKVELPVKPDSAGWSREALAEFRDRLDWNTFTDLQIIVSELVVDAVRDDHESDDQITLLIELLDRHIRVEMRDGAGAYEPQSERPEPGERGWGVHLAGLLGDNWRSWREGPRGCVSVQMPLAGAA